MPTGSRLHDPAGGFGEDTVDAGCGSATPALLEHRILVPVLVCLAASDAGDAAGKGDVRAEPEQPQKRPLLISRHGTSGSRAGSRT